jgi:hypothetical protein
LELLNEEIRPSLIVWMKGNNSFSKVKARIGKKNKTI